MTAPRHVLVTGSSTGIGRAIALHLAARGWIAYAGVRRESDAESLRAEAGSANLRPIILDITDVASIAAATTLIQKDTGAASLNALVNNAGISINGPVELLTTDDWRNQFEVNLFGQIAMTRAMLPLLRAAATPAATSRIVMMSSIAGRVGQPIIGPYCASKFALEAVSDALRLELKSQHIEVSLVEPGAIKSEIWKKAQDSALAIDRKHPAAERYTKVIDAIVTMARQAEDQAIPASRVAEIVEHCLTSSRPPIRRLVGRDAKIGALAKWMFPDRLFDAALTRAFKL